MQRHDLTGLDFTKSDLSKADFRNSDLRGSNFTGCDLAGAEISGADFRGAIGLDALTRAYLKECGAIVDEPAPPLTAQQRAVLGRNLVDD